MDNSMTAARGFGASLIAFQAICLVIFAAHFSTGHVATITSEVDPARLRDYYPMFMDVHVMIFIGFGFLMTYLRKYSLSAVSLNFVIGALSLQWGTIVVKLIHQIGEGHSETPVLDIPAMIQGDFAAGAVLITFGAVLGKVTPTQLVWMTFLEIIVYGLNEYILIDVLHVIDAGGSMVIHTFGAFFGLALSWTFGLPSEKESTHNASRYTSDIFSMIGTVFLWMYWPSFNAAMVPADGLRQERAVVNTLLSIAASCISAFIVSVMVSPKKKFNMVHLQNSTLAGGVAMGASCDLALHPAAAVAVGFTTGMISVIGYQFIMPIMEKHVNLSDTAGIFYLHGIPGVIGGLVCSVATMMISDDTYSGTVSSIYSARSHRSSGTQGWFQFLALLVTLAMALVSGVAVGCFLRSHMFTQQTRKFEDGEWFLTEEDEETETDEFKLKDNAKQGLIASEFVQIASPKNE